MQNERASLDWRLIARLLLPRPKGKIDRNVAGVPRARTAKTSTTGDSVVDGGGENMHCCSTAVNCLRIPGFLQMAESAGP